MLLMRCLASLISIIWGVAMFVIGLFALMFFLAFVVGRL